MKLNHDTMPLSQLTLLWLTLLLALGAPALAVDITAGFDQANKLYEEGKYADAVQAYDKLLSGGDLSEALLFNRGNALFKTSQLGRAIASWRQAEQLAPRDPAVRENLTLARTQAQGGVVSLRRDMFTRYLELLTLNEWAVAGAIGIWCFFLILGFSQYNPKSASRLRPWLVFSGAAMLVFGLSLAMALNQFYFTTSAVVISGEVEVRNGPLDESTGMFKLRDGAELNVMDRKDNWLQVEDSAQRVGWVRQDQVLVLESAGSHAPKS